MRTTQADVELLMKRLVEPVRKMLRESGGFLPFGAYLDTARRVRKFQAEVDDAWDQDELAGFFEEKLQGYAAAKKAVATAIVRDVRAAPPGKRKAEDCAAFALDHVDGYSVIVFLPYVIDEGGKVLFGELFAIDGDSRIFS
ncbi:MAG TPA: hypothetical protein VIV61_01310 [Candidatus Ozemobacteraceae bacterium]